MKYIEFFKTYWLLNPCSPVVAGKVVAGNNGLYGEPETVYRNAAHWLLIAKYLREVDPSTERFIKEMIDLFLCDGSNHLPFIARKSSKNRSNGIIGTAWIVESLSEFIGVECYRSRELENLCRSLLKVVPFDNKKGVWTKIVEPDGSYLEIDRTFNHQLWMNMAHHKFLQSSEDTGLRSRTLIFDNMLSKNLKTNKFGLVYHTLGAFPHFQKTYLKRILSKNYRESMLVKEFGYHAFNLLALSKIYQLSGSEKLRILLTELVSICEFPNFWSNQLDNCFGSHYNPVGLELAVVIDRLELDKSFLLRSLNFHFHHCFDANTFSFKSDSDGATLNARVYELIGLSRRTKDSLRFSVDSNTWYFSQ